MLFRARILWRNPGIGDDYGGLGDDGELGGLGDDGGLGDGNGLGDVDTSLELRF